MTYWLRSQAGSVTGETAAIGGYGLSVMCLGDR